MVLEAWSPSGNRNTKLPWVHSVTSRCPSWYDIKCCQDLKLHQPSNQPVCWWACPISGRCRTWCPLPRLEGWCPEWAGWWGPHRGTQPWSTPPEGRGKVKNKANKGCQETWWKRNWRMLQLFFQIFPFYLFYFCYVSVTPYQIRLTDRKRQQNVCPLLFGYEASADMKQIRQMLSV